MYFARRGYMEQRPYSVMTHTLSALEVLIKITILTLLVIFRGDGFCGTAMIPIILYIRRKIAVMSELGAWVGSLLFLMGCIAIILTGVFPDAHGKVVGSSEWRDIHMKSAVTIAVGFGLGLICIGY